jgi:hypothetical protein
VGIPEDSIVEDETALKAVKFLVIAGWVIQAPPALIEIAKARKAAAEPAPGVPAMQLQAC